MRQIIIVRKDLNMSAGKLSAQVAHASLAYFTTIMKHNAKQIHQYRHIAIDENGNLARYRRVDLDRMSKDAYSRGEKYFYARPLNIDDPYGPIVQCSDIYKTECKFEIDNSIFENWINGSFTKTVCEAKNKYQLLKAVDIANGLGLYEGIDFFLIKDNCLTELTPEEIDKNGIGRTLTCIGFKPLDDDIAHQISKKYQLFK